VLTMAMACCSGAAGRGLRPLIGFHDTDRMIPPRSGIEFLSAVAEAERDRTRERITEVKRDQRQRGRYLGGTPPFGWRVGEAGDLVPVPDQQATIRRMRKLKDQGLALRVIAETMTASGVQISHVGVKKALAAADRASA
jgi:DNA invertase Pin-like site-specific DNA recombinase